MALEKEQIVNRGPPYYDFCFFLVEFWFFLLQGKFRERWWTASESLFFPPEKVGECL